MIPKDNAMAERINSTVKNELLHGKALDQSKPKPVANPME